jgi:hypothetical protein
MPCTVEYKADKEVVLAATEHAVGALKQLMTIASAMLVLTITFHKDFEGGKPLGMLGKVLLGHGWAFLLVSIWLAWVAIADAMRALGTRGICKYVFASGKPRLLAHLAQWMFFLGLLWIALYAFVGLFGF